MKKENTKLRVLCVECTHRNSCPDAERFANANLIGCSDYKPWKKWYSRAHCASEERET